MHRAIVVGGGAVGLATALSLVEQHRQEVTVLEAEDGLARHQTGHNSGVIHAGLYYRPDSLKAELCRTGREEMYRFCDSEGVPYRRCGKLVVATHERELPQLAALVARGTANGVTLRRLERTELKEYEPAVSGIAGLWVDDTGVVSYPLVAEAMARRITALGGTILLRHRVLAIHRDGPIIIVETNKGIFRTNRFVNCAGLQCDRVARMAGLDPGVRIVPFRGEYYALRPRSAHLVRGLIYPVPNPDLPFLGVHFTRGIDDVVEAGPNAVLALRREGYSWGDVSASDIADWAFFPGFWRMCRGQWRNGLAEVRRSLSRARFLASLRTLIPDLGDADIDHGGSGVRAQAVDRTGKLLDDFHLRATAGMVHVLNAPSPAATASIVIGRVVASRSMET